LRNEKEDVPGELSLLHLLLSL
jgi:hypothetical protein